MNVLNIIHISHAHDDCVASAQEQNHLFAGIKRRTE